VSGLRTIILLLSIAGLISAGPGTTPCSSVGRSLTKTRKSRLAIALASQLHVSKVEVLQSFAVPGWNIIYVDTHESDPGFLFYSGDPLTTRPVTQWGGAAMPDEETEIKAWTLKNAPGIPAQLAGCFAWHVTHDRDR
jgi:hypothetical protein